MKLVHVQYNISLDFPQDNLKSLIIENNSVFYKLVNEFYLSYEGDVTNWILSEKDAPISIKDNVDMIFNPFMLDINNKKYLDKLYILLKKEINETELSKDYIDLNQSIKKFGEKMSLNSKYNLENSIDIDAKNMLKYLNIRLEDRSENIFERMLDYIRYGVDLLNIKLFVLVNIKSYMDEYIFQKFVDEITYNKYNVLMIDNIDIMQNEKEEKYIIDKDDCIIH